jgi:quinone-modifying oxidoreductase, subunit QmoB
VPPGEVERTLFVFGCQRSAGIVAQGMDMPEHVRFHAVPCAGSVSENVIWSGLAAGARGILVVGCHHGNCASHSGTDWAAARVRRTLETGVLTTEAPRVGYATIAANEPGRFNRLVSAFLVGLPAIP